jgi:hypothetical protein
MWLWIDQNQQHPLVPCGCLAGCALFLTVSLACNVVLYLNSNSAYCLLIECNFSFEHTKCIIMYLLTCYLIKVWFCPVLFHTCFVSDDTLAWSCLSAVVFSLVSRRKHKIQYMMIQIYCLPLVEYYRYWWWDLYDVFKFMFKRNGSYENECIK